MRHTPTLATTNVVLSPSASQAPSDTQLHACAGLRAPDGGRGWFIADTDEGSLVRFTHRGWTDRNALDREKFTEWPTLLDRFAAVAARNASDSVDPRDDALSRAKLTTRGDKPDVDEMFTSTARTRLGQHREFRPS
jgi:hypothetical protein